MGEENAEIEEILQQISVKLIFTCKRAKIANLCLTLIDFQRNQIVAVSMRIITITIQFSYSGGIFAFRNKDTIYRKCFY